MATGCVATMLPLGNACSDASEVTTVTTVQLDAQQQQQPLGSEVQCTPRNASAAQAGGPFHSPHTPSFMTQAIKKQPRSPRDQVSPKRARVGAAGEEQEPGQDEQREEACPATVPIGGSSSAADAAPSEDTPPTPIFSPAFHLTGRPSQADPHHASLPVPPPPHHARWGDQQSPRYQGHAPAGAPSEADALAAPHAGSAAPALAVPQLCLPPHVLAAQLRLQHDQPGELQQHMDAHPHPHAHHTVIPEASEHELPPPLNLELGAAVHPPAPEQQQQRELDDAQMAVAAVEGSLAMVHVQQQQQQQQQQQEQPPQQQEQQQQQQSEELEVMDFDPLLFIKQLPPLELVVPPHRAPLLPGKTPLCKPKTLVLDLDETLVHSCLEAHALADFTFPVHFNSHEHIIHVRQRPHLHTFMERVAELYEVVVFTASQKIYAEKLLNIIDPQRRLIKHRIFRESCVVVEGNYLKDLSVLGRDLRTTLIVDNSPQAFGFQVDNGVPIESWYDDPADQELLKLLPFLEQLVHAEDVRPAIRSRFRMRELIDGIVLC